MSSQLWFYRTKPQEDELFSSWLVRLASGLAIRLQTFSTQVLGVHPGFWTGDVDKRPNLGTLARLREGTAVPLERARATGLAAFEGHLWETFYAVGPVAWLMPIGRNGRRHQKHGLQYCRQCLSTDSHPYFRRKWRLAFNFACDFHDIFLEDACPNCQSPVEFHTGDYGQRLLTFECPITRCGTCREDFREWRPNVDRKAPYHLVQFQRALNNALYNGFHNHLPGAQAYSHLMFTGLHHLTQLLCSSGRFSRVRDWLTSGSEINTDNVNVSNMTGLKFEILRVSERAFILDLAFRLIQDWPHTFVEACFRSRVSSSYILSYDGPLPHWFSYPVEWYLDDRDYAPSSEERSAVESYLLKNKLPITRNNVNRWLGVSSVDKSVKGVNKKRERWNPRGPTEKKH